MADGAAPTEPRLPAEIRMTIAREATTIDPITVECTAAPYSENNRVHPGWLNLTQVNRTWRETCIGYAGLWADQACTYPSKRALEVFFKRAQYAPVTADLDRLLVACYKLKRPSPIHWLLKDNCHLLRDAKIISSTLARDLDTGSTFSALECGLGPTSWPTLFNYSAHGYLTHLEYHITKDNDFPRIIDSPLEYLRIINVQERIVSEETAEGNFVQTRYYTRGWKQPPKFDFESLLHGINLLKRLKTAVFDAISIIGSPHKDLRPVFLPQLTRLDMRGPSPAQYVRFDKLIHPQSIERLRVTSSEESFVAPAEALAHVQVGSGGDTTVTIEAGAWIRWTTLSICDPTVNRRSVFCADDVDPEVTAELDGDATLLIRPGTLSRKYTKNKHNNHDEFLGAPRKFITHLIVRELTRTYQRELVWQMPETDFGFINGLTSLKKVRIEDERVVAAVCQNLCSTKLQKIEIVCRPDWKGSSPHGTFTKSLKGVANRCEKDLVVVFSGAKRISDQAKVDELGHSALWTFVDQRIELDGIESEFSRDPLEAALQLNRQRKEGAQNEVKILLAMKEKYAWL